MLLCGERPVTPSLTERFRSVFGFCRITERLSAAAREAKCNRAHRASARHSRHLGKDAFLALRDSA
ncbi:MAG: hypothetical protein FD139_3597 [Methylocystaceae bacterium]|nr:MAG: hypothetical protein FD172_3509 [Methylocystaceae bacterium]TXT42425.1 MAG: hypothetical protein FD139_3597 [Methylocystaceae bacterium]